MFPPCFPPTDCFLWIEKKKSCSSLSYSNYDQRLPLLSSNIEIQWSERNNRRTKSIGAGGGGGRFSFLNFRPSETGTNSSGLISALPRRTSSWETWKGKISSLSHVRMKPIFRIRSFLRIFLWEYVWGRISWFSCAEEEFKVYFILFGICRYLICNFCRRRRRTVFPPHETFMLSKKFLFYDISMNKIVVNSIVAFKSFYVIILI